jgi:CPA2 family monovalent cation:H+ antiporter-2
LHADSLLAPLVLVYALALLFVVVLARLRIPSIVALMIAGMAAGPSGLRIIGTPEQVDALAEIGVVLLLFTVGLDFSLTAVRQTWRAILGGGTLQIAGTAAIVALALTALTRTPANLATFIGLFVALSSTAIVIKALVEHNQLSAPHGRLMVGILLLQDLAIVVLLLLVPMLSGRMPLSAAGVAIGKGLLAIAAVAGASRLVLPPLLRIVTASGRREAFPLAIFVASVGTAWASSLLGVSMAVGAFLAGLMLAESEYSHQAYAEIRGIRDILAALFFTSLGMLLDLSFVAREFPTVLAAAVAIVIVKAGVATVALLLVGTTMRVAAIAGIGLAQVGEFSFILGRAGLDGGFLPISAWQTLLGASILTMVATPSLMHVAPAIAARLKRRSAPAPADAAPDDDSHHEGHVIIVGFGVGGQLVAEALRELHTPYVVLELNGLTVRRAKAEGHRIMYGDATSPESLHGLRVETAAAIVNLTSDPDASARMVTAVREISKTVPIIVRTRYRIEADRLLAGGATVAVAEELEASLEVVAQLLARLQVPGNAIDTLLEMFRRQAVTRRPVRAHRPSFSALPEPIQRMPVATHRVDEGQWAVGKTLAELDLRARTGANIIAVQNGDEYNTSPAVDRRTRAGDVLYLTGDDSDIALARRRLESGA